MPVIMEPQKMLLLLNHACIRWLGSPKIYAIGIPEVTFRIGLRGEIARLNGVGENHCPSAVTEQHSQHLGDRLGIIGPVEPLGHSICSDH